MRFAAVIVVSLGCGGTFQTRADSSGDANAGPCTGTMLSAELLDLDSTTAALRGVAGAKVAVQGMPSIATVPPDGKLALCVPSANPIMLAIDGPAAYLDGPAYIAGEVVRAGAPIRLRSFTAERATALYAERGLAYDPSKAHVLAYQAGDTNQLTLDRPHAPVQFANDDDDTGRLAWNTTDGGRYVLFPNVEATQPPARWAAIHITRTRSR